MQRPRVSPEMEDADHMTSLREAQHEVEPQEDGVTCSKLQRITANYTTFHTTWSGAQVLAEGTQDKEEAGVDYAYAGCRQRGLEVV